MKSWQAFLCALLLCGAAHAQSGSNAAFEAGKALGQAGANQASTGISTPKAGMEPEKLVPSFNGNPSQSGYFAGGKGDTKPLGTQKMVDCANATAEELAGYAGKPCDAINFLARNPQRRPNIAIGKTDPLRATASNVISAANKSTLLPGSKAGTTEQNSCTTTTTPEKSTYEQKICHLTGSVSTNGCTNQREVEVAASFNYQCQSQPQTLRTLTCDRVMNTTCSGAQVTERCNDGSIPINGICTSTVSEKEPASISGYNCPSGYTLSGSTCSQTLTQGATISSYSCPSGTTLSGSQCLTTTSAAATPAYACPSGYSLSGSTCSKVNTQGGTPVYTCPSGSTLQGTQCVSPTNEYSPATVSTYTCPSGYTLSGSTCSQTLTQGATISSYSCPAGATLSGSQCLTTTSAAATPAYACPSGYSLSGTTCSKTNTQAGSPVYACRAGGTLSGNQCTYVITTTSEAITNHSCTSGALTPGVLQGGIQSYVCCSDAPTNNCLALEGKSQ